MNKTWIYEQTERNVLQWDGAMETHYPESGSWLRDPDAYFNRLCGDCNYLDAVKLIDWNAYLKNDSRILDVGCGGGWLAGYLSGFEAVSTIYALDSSRRFLSDLLPQVTRIMNGNAEKIETIEGMFTPLLFQDASLDMVVASSALHHADSLEGVLREIRRVLKKDGLLLILNETPRPWLRYVLSLAVAFARMIGKAIAREYERTSPSISSSGFLYDPLLGDKSYPSWYWQEAIRRSGFSLVEVVNTGLPTVKGDRGAGLTHFICRAA
ncbi:MAG: class I SAM-dependent methyltransferase [Nitrosomonadales bacterium]|nr:class I SAM-dependent methyltransferase [Nitrosomonadales bacterium]